jgi:putative flippase GtrA
MAKKPCSELRRVMMFYRGSVITGNVTERQHRRSSCFEQSGVRGKSLVSHRLRLRVLKVMEGLLATIFDAWHRRTVLAKLFSYASIGLVNVIVDVATFTVAFKLVGLPLVPSNVVSWFVAVTGSYAMNTKITFEKETGGLYSLGRYASFAASGIFGLVVATTTLVVLSQYVNIPVAKLVSIVAAFGVNFSVSHFFVFRMPRAS